MSVQKFNAGDTAVVNSKHTQYDAKSYGVHEGMEVKIVGKAYDSYYYVKLSNEQQIQMTSSALDKSHPKSNREKFLEQITKAEEKIKSTQSFINETKEKISFMEETDSELFDENEFKAYRTLSIIEQGNMSKIEKAKAIAALIK
jgi:carbonic anhydrase